MIACLPKNSAICDVADRSFAVLAKSFVGPRDSNDTEITCLWQVHSTSSMSKFMPEASKQSRVRAMTAKCSIQLSISFTCTIKRVVPGALQEA